MASRCRTHGELRALFHRKLLVAHPVTTPRPSLQSCARELSLSSCSIEKTPTNVREERERGGESIEQHRRAGPGLVHGPACALDPVRPNGYGGGHAHRGEKPRNPLRVAQIAVPAACVFSEYPWVIAAHCGFCHQAVDTGLIPPSKVSRLLTSTLASLLPPTPAAATGQQQHDDDARRHVAALSSQYARLLRVGRTPRPSLAAAERPLRALQVGRRLSPALL